MKKVLYYLCHPTETLIKLDESRIIKLNDIFYLKLKFKNRNKYKLNLKNPKSFNEKMQWLKLNDQKSKYTTMADKYEVKKYVANLIGEKYIISLIGVFEKYEDIDFKSLPEQFVIKCTHDSGGLVICRDKKSFDYDKTKRKIENSLKNNYYYKGREWPYKNIKPRIIVEEYIKDDKIDDLRDYKFMCFNGKVKYIYVTVKNDNIWENYYDTDFKPIDINHGFPRYENEFEKPENLKEMIEIAEKLAKDIPFLRVDLHNVNGKILFGETTFYDWGRFQIISKF